MTKKLITVAELSERWGIHADTIRHWSRHPRHPLTPSPLSSRKRLYFNLAQVIDLEGGSLAEKEAIKERELAFAR